MAHTTTPNLGVQDFFTTTLSGNVLSTDTVINLTAVPTPTEGYLIIDPNTPATREEIYYNSKTSSTVTCPDNSGGSSRGLGGTSVQAHNNGVTVEMRFTAEHYVSLQNGESLGVGSVTSQTIANGAIAPNNLYAAASAAEVTATQATSSGYAIDLATLGPQVTVSLGANGMALVGVKAFMYQTNGTAYAYMGFGISGTASMAATTDDAISYQALTGDTGENRSGTFLLTGLPPGQSTFTAKYGTQGAGTAGFGNRQLFVIPL